MSPLAVPVRCLPNGEGMDLPAYATAGAAGLDLAAAIEAPRDLAPGARMLVPTGIAIALPTGYEGQVRPRSGLALEHGVSVLNAPGTIDSDYRGEIKVLLINLGDRPVRLTRAMRIAQLVIAPIVRLAWAPTAELPASARAAAGFGSTGT
jgi:dUTP diphosphatase